MEVLTVTKTLIVRTMKGPMTAPAKLASRATAKHAVVSKQAAFQDKLYV